jgi:hypothetical protein
MTNQNAANARATNLRRRGFAREQFPDLDRLVLTEIEAMVERTCSELSSRKDAPARRREPPIRRAPEGVRTKQRNPPRETPRRPEADMWDGGDLSGPADAGLLGEEEEKFIEETVAWLQDRPNADILIATIWSRVVDSDADAFHSAPGPTADDSRSRPEDQPPMRSDEERPEPAP